MENREKRDRGSNWNHAQTTALAELKRVNEEHGRLVWELIAQTLSSRFPDQIRTGDQCRRRWDTLVKVYNHIEDFCVVTGQDHRELDEGELASMKLATAYHQDWYDIVEQVCSQVSERKRKEKCDRDHMLAKRSKGSHSVEHPEQPPNRVSLCSTSTSIPATCHEHSAPESTTTYAQVFCSPSLEADKLSPEEEVPRLMNGNAGLILEQSATACAQASDSRPSLEADELSPEEEVPRLKHGNDGLMLEHSTTAYAQVSSSPNFVLEATGLRQHGEVSHDVSQEPETLESVDVLPHTFLAGSGVQLKEPLQNDLWAWDDELPFGTSAEIEQPDAESEFAESFYWDCDLESVEIKAQSEEPLYDHVWDHVWDHSLHSSMASIAGESNSSGISFSSQQRSWHSERGARPLSRASRMRNRQSSTDSWPPIKHLGANSTAVMPVFKLGAFLFLFQNALLFVFLGALFFVFLGALLFGIQNALLFVFLGALLFVFLGALLFGIQDALLFVFLGALLFVFLGALLFVFLGAMIMTTMYFLTKRGLDDLKTEPTMVS